MNNTVYWLWLKDAAKPYTVRRLLQTYGNIENVYNRTDYTEASYIRTATLKKLLDKNITKAMNILDKCNRSGIKILTPDLPEFPPRLKNVKDSPSVLFAKGIIPDWESIFPVAVVGTRKLSPEGAFSTKEITRELVASGATVVSGFAAGADTVAAEAALDNNGFTVAVLGCGVDVVYPKSNSSLYMRVVKGGLFLSEYPPGTLPHPFLFPERNRIIAGLSRCVVVTEAPEKSGAVITAGLAKKYGREVFAVSPGADFLTNQGAISVHTGNDIAAAYEELTEATLPQTQKESCSDPILSALAEADMSIDDIAIKLNISMTECNSRCFMLELEGKIIKLPGGFYHLI